jgi:hypothetical protein
MRVVLTIASAKIYIIQTSNFGDPAYLITGRIAQCATTSSITGAELGSATRGGCRSSRMSVASRLPVYSLRLKRSRHYLMQFMHR